MGKILAIVLCSSEDLAPPHSTLSSTSVTVPNVFPGMMAASYTCDITSCKDASEKEVALYKDQICQEILFHLKLHFFAFLVFPYDLSSARMAKYNGWLALFNSIKDENQWQTKGESINKR